MAAIQREEPFAVSSYSPCLVSLAVISDVKINNSKLHFYHADSSTRTGCMDSRHSTVTVIKNGIGQVQQPFYLSDICRKPKPGEESFKKLLLGIGGRARSRTAVAPSGIGAWFTMACCWRRARISKCTKPPSINHAALTSTSIPEFPHAADSTPHAAPEHLNLRAP